MTQRLTRAHKVAHIRELRSQRARLEARKALGHSEAALLAARNVLDERTNIRRSAEDSFAVNPADENARIWLLASTACENTASQSCTEARKSRDVAKQEAAMALREHERAIQRVEIMQSELARERLDRIRREEERALDEITEQQG